MNVQGEPVPNILLATPTPEPTPTATDHTQYPSETNAHYPSASEGRHEEKAQYESMQKPSNQSSYTDKISSATSAIADKAVTAKNVVASKVGYGNDKPTTTTHEDQGKTEDAKASTVSGSATEYGKKISVSLTDKLAPVYGTVAGVGSAVKSKVSGTTNGADRGVSMKDYLAEKLRPGDEDRALSEVISETLQKRKEEPRTEDEEAEKTEHRRLGKVTESEEVKRRLGGLEEKDRGSQESFASNSEKGVVDKLKDAVGSWFGTTGENQFSQSQGIWFLIYILFSIYLYRIDFGLIKCCTEIINSEFAAFRLQKVKVYLRILEQKKGLLAKVQVKEDFRSHLIEEILMGTLDRTVLSGNKRMLD